MLGTHKALTFQQHAILCSDNCVWLVGTTFGVILLVWQGFLYKFKKIWFFSIWDSKCFVNCKMCSCIFYSEVKMDRGSPICERVLKKIVEYIKLQRLCKSHHLQCITSSKDSEKLEKSLCVRDKAQELCWMPVVFRPSALDTASLIGMILSLTLLNGPRNTSRNHCR